MARRVYDYAVTYENPESRAPETVRGKVDATTLRAACSRAVAEANKYKTTRGYLSVLVLLTIDREEASDV